MRRIVVVLSLIVPVACASRAPQPPTASAGLADAMREGVIASTNEPFWRVHADAQRMELNGLQATPRTFVVERAALEDRRWRGQGHDAAGKLTLEVVERPCQDSMSGATFPFTASLAVDAAEPLSGCARPASMPMPELGWR